MLTIKNFFSSKKYVTVACDRYEKEIRVTFMQQCVTVFTMSELYNIVRSYLGTIYGPRYLTYHRVSLQAHGKLLNETKSLSHYVWDEVTSIEVRVYALFGGSGGDIHQTNMLSVSYMNALVRQIEQQCLQETARDSQSFVLQASETASERANAEFEKMCGFIAAQIEAHFPDEDTTLMMWENLLLTWKISRKCDCVDDYITLACTSYRLFTGKPYTKFLMSKVTAMFGQVQADDLGEIMGKLRGYVNFAEEVGEHPFYKKITGMYSYLLVQGFLTRFGLTLNDEDYSRIEQRALHAQFSSRKGLWMSVLDTTLFICERLHEWKLTGDISCFLHSQGEYSGWLKEADRILNLGPFTGNLEAHGTSYFSFISDLNEAVEKGEAYSKFSRKANGSEVLAIKRKLCSLQLLKNTEITKRATQKERPAPFGVLVYGGSSVGKSTFTKMLFYYYGSLMGLEKDDHFRYVRNPADEYWSNFDSSKWCIQLDDIAFLLPKKTSEADPTLMEMLNVVNNVPYVPTQAALEDKGKTPVLAKLVVATSNAGDLNAREYFWCPLAVQRRLPFVVNIKPKAEYLHTNGSFLNPSSLPLEHEGYPDYWNITVQKVVPHFDGERDQAILETVKTYTNVVDFLRDFGQNALAHENVQTKAMNCDSYMREVVVCRDCHSPGHMTCAELQVREDSEWIVAEMAQSYSYSLAIRNGIWRFYCWTIHLRYVLWMLQYVAHWQVCRNLMYRWFLPTLSDSLQVMLAGRIAGDLTSPRKWKMAIGLVTVLAGCAALYVALKPKKVEEPQMEEQGNVYSTTEEQLPREERQNVWYNPVMELTRFDVPIASQSLATASVDQIRDLFSNNCVRLLIQTQKDGVTTTRSNAGVFLKGHLCLTNNHAFRDDADIFRVTVVRMNGAQGLSSNLTITVRKQDIVRRPGNDVALFDVRSMPPCKDITKFWDINGGSMYSRAIVLRRMEDGSLEKQEIFNLQHSPDFPVEALGIRIPVTMGQGPRITAKGDCGAIGIAMTPRGPVVFGLHIMGYGNTCGIVCVDLTLINEMITSHESEFGKFSEVQGGGEPMLCTKDIQNPLTVPHYKSLFRYLPEGSLNVYGSFTGFRPRPKSSVCATPLQENMMEYFDCTINHGRPCMDGWEPWRKNVVEMVQPTVTYRKDVLAMCVDSFTNDILTGLPEGWERQMVFLSRKASVNGIPGVRFVDRLNTSTSMGFPWNCTKKKFLHTDIEPLYPEGVDFDEEVWDRVTAIEKCYAEGRRAYPVFTGHLKDEPTTHAKIASKKTRVFTGGPVDWSIVVRSRLLSFVKLLQENKFLFEAGPGTVCQSSEWGDIYEYLTAFGTDRIVAGDYGKFDKRMIADFVLAAFRIIANVYEAAGFTPEEVREILCIGEDTAFPLTNLNGDLVEFFGTNPSGHPLTVIVNSIVNSLYVRYCYVVLNPEHECASFKAHVKLMTYGDDNVMGVHRLRDWFNHTAIQRELTTIGVEYTMADKESESVPFIDIADVQFLKRKWVYDSDVKAWLCPLEEASIHKSLTVWLPSKSIDKYAQMVAVISSANSEYFFYGREIFEKHHIFFKSILVKYPYCCYVGTGTLPNWEQLVDRFDRANWV